MGIITHEAGRSLGPQVVLVITRLVEMWLGQGPPGGFEEAGGKCRWYVGVGPVM